MQYLVILECTGLGIFICHVTHIILLLYELLNTKQNKKQTNKQTKNKTKKKIHLINYMSCKKAIKSPKYVHFKSTNMFHIFEDIDNLF